MELGYNTAGLDRGSHFPLSDLEEQYARDFVAIADEVNANTPTSVTIHQRDAFSQRDENIRDEIMDRLGYIFHFDIDGMLSKSEYGSTVTVAPHDKERLNLKDASEPLSAEATIRHLRFGNIATKATVSMFEIEFEAPVMEANGDARERMVRIITCMSESSE